MIDQARITLLALLEHRSVHILEQFHELTRAGELARQYNKGRVTNAFASLEVEKTDDPYELELHWLGIELRFNCMFGLTNGAKHKATVFCTLNHSIFGRPSAELLLTFTFDESGTTNLPGDEGNIVTLTGGADAIVLRCLDLASIAIDRLAAGNPASKVDLGL